MIVGGGKSSELSRASMGEGGELEGIVDGCKVESRVAGARLVGLAFAGLEVGANEGTPTGDGLAVMPDTFHVTEKRMPIMSLVVGAMIILVHWFNLPLHNNGCIFAHHRTIESPKFAFI